MILKIEGSDKKISQIARELKIRARRGNLKITTEKSGKAIKSKNPKHAVDLIALIEKVETIEGLEEFKADKRATVVAAYQKRMEELTSSGDESTPEEVVELIQKVETIEDLEKFESDERDLVVAAVNSKREELDLA